VSLRNDILETYLILHAVPDHALLAMHYSCTHNDRGSSAQNTHHVVDEEWNSGYVSEAESSQNYWEAKSRFSVSLTHVSIHCGAHDQIFVGEGAWLT